MMKISPWLIVVATATLCATVYTWWHGQDDPSLVVLSTKAMSLPENGGEHSHKPSSQSWKIDRDRWLDAATDPFVPKQPPPPPPPPPVPPLPPAKPLPPPFPYQYFGQMTLPNGEHAIYLTQDNRLLPISAKQIIDTNYQVESISDAEIVIIYLPLGTRTTLPIPAAPSQAGFP